MKNMKKGFTIIEMVIVIAIIGILAAVMIPTFSSVVEKANKSAALQSCRNELVEVKAAFAIRGTDVPEGTIFGYKDCYFEYKDGKLQETAKPSADYQEAKLANVSVYQKHGAVMTTELPETVTNKMKETFQDWNPNNPTVALNVGVIKDTAVSYTIYKDEAVFHVNSGKTTKTDDNPYCIITIFDQGLSYGGSNDTTWKMEPQSKEAAKGYYTYELTVGDETATGIFYYDGTIAQ